MVISKITNAKIDNEVVNKEFKQNLQIPITFESDINLALFMFDSYLMGFILIFIISLTIYFMYKTQDLLKLKLGY